MRNRTPPARRLRRPALLTLLAVLPALCLVMFTGNSASAHGAPMSPGSRTYLCWKYSLSDTGEIKPTNPACQAALDQGGSNAFYNWFAVLRSDGAGQTEGFIPDGELCSGAATVYDFSGFDLARDDWPYTHVTAGATYEITYNMWAAHPGTFRMYITEDTYDANETLTWADIEDEPFYTVTDPASRGSVGTEDGAYYWDATLPSDKSGRHIIYTVWERSDSNETFYSCSDVVFDGGNGEVTVPTSDGSDDGSDDGGDTGDDGGDTGDDGGDTTGCTATVSSVNSWSGGFQAEVTVTNATADSISGWTASWTQPSGNSITSLWNGSLTQHDDHLMVSNASWNGSLGSGSSTTFGYVANGSPPTAGETLSCSVTT